MIGVVIRDQQDFAQVCMPFAVRNLRGQIPTRVLDQLDDLLKVGEKTGDRSLPCLLRRIASFFRPVAVGEGRRSPRSVERVAQNVFLREARSEEHTSELQ